MKIDSTQEKLHPPISTAKPGDPYCGNCGYFLTGLDNSARCPECGKPIVEVLMRREFSIRTGKRYRSEATLFGLPVIDIAIGPFGQERIGKARGIIAIGDMAFGALAIGGIARGVVAIGGFTLGIFSIGGFAAGLLTAMGGFAASLGISNGGFSIGGAAFGGVAIGFIAQGGLARGIFASGGMAIGNPFPSSFSRFHWLLGNSAPTPLDLFRSMLFTFASAILASAPIGLLAARPPPGISKKDRVAVD